MNAQLIFQQLASLTSIALNKGKEKEEAAKDAETLVKLLVKSASTLASRFKESNRELIFHQLSQSAYVQFQSNADVTKVAEYAENLIVDLLTKAETLQALAGE